MIHLALCNNCGLPFDENDIQDGFCLACQPEGDPDIQKIVDEIKPKEDAE